MGLWSGRSSLTSRRRQGSDEPKRSTRRKIPAQKKEVDDVAPRQPDLEELRSRRTEYYGVPSSQRRKAASSNSSRTASRRSSNTSLSRQSHRHRRHATKETSARPKVERRDARISVDEYVYGSRRDSEQDIVSPRAKRRRSNRSASEKSSTNNTVPALRSVLSTITDEELTPADSISQVGRSDRVERVEYTEPARPYMRRRRTTSSKLSPLPEESAPVLSASKSRNYSKTPAPPSTSATTRRNSTTSVPVQPRLVECLTCGEETPSTRSAKLACGHRMCHDCLKRIFEMSVKDPQHMPPKCCTDAHIPLKHVDKLFDTKFKILWNRKFQEYHTKNRIYCPTPRCGEWIKPSHIYTHQGRKYALCPRCKTKVCTTCNHKSHKSSECPKDPEIAKLVEQAKEKGWQRCYKCKAFVERGEGCNHMTCRCTAEFCIVCGLKWKTCDCPWFDYPNVLADGDRLNHMRVPEPVQVLYRQVFRGGADPVDRERRRQERADADLARRLQMASLFEDHGEGDAGADDPAARIWGVGNAAGHFMNDDFVLDATNVIMNAFGDTSMGRRGERQSGRRRRAVPNEPDDAEPGLAPDFLGDQGVLGAVPGTRRRRTRP